MSQAQDAMQRGEAQFSDTKTGASGVQQVEASDPSSVLGSDGGGGRPGAGQAQSMNQASSGSAADVLGSDGGGGRPGVGQAQSTNQPSSGSAADVLGSDGGGGRVGSTTATSSNTGNTGTTGTAGTGASQGSTHVPDGAMNNPKNLPQTAKDASLVGTIPGDNVSFKEQVQGHAKYFAGKVFGNDKEVRKGSERVAGVETADESNTGGQDGTAS